MKKYHGWIILEKNTVLKDSVSAEWVDVEGNRHHLDFGPGNAGAAKACEHFEQVLELGTVKLEATPIGLRVFTEEES